MTDKRRIVLRTLPPSPPPGCLTIVSSMASQCQGGWHSSLSDRPAVVQLWWVERAAGGRAWAPPSEPVIFSSVTALSFLSTWHSLKGRWVRRMEMGRSGGGHFSGSDDSITQKGASGEHRATSYSATAEECPAWRQKKCERKCVMCTWGAWGEVLNRVNKKRVSEWVGENNNNRKERKRDGGSLFGHVVSDSMLPWRETHRVEHHTKPRALTQADVSVWKETTVIPTQRFTKEEQHQKWLQLTCLSLTAQPSPHLH